MDFLLWLAPQEMFLPDRLKRKKTKPSHHSYSSSVLAKHFIDWYKAWPIWGPSVSAQVTPSGKSKHLRKRPICGYSAKFTTNRTWFQCHYIKWDSKIPRHPLTQTGGVPKSRQPGCRHGQVRSCTDRVHLHRWVMKLRTLKPRFIVPSFRCLSDMLGCWVAWDRRRERERAAAQWQFLLCNMCRMLWQVSFLFPVQKTAQEGA